MGKRSKAFSFVQRLTTNDVAAVSDGKVQYSCFPNGKGGIVDDLLVYRIDAETYLLVVNAANIEKDWAWCVQNAEEMGLEVGKELYNASDEICQLAVQGPLALKQCKRLLMFLWKTWNIIHLRKQPLQELKMQFSQQLVILVQADVRFM